jgi:ATP-dependent DNA ligase
VSEEDAGVLEMIDGGPASPVAPPIAPMLARLARELPRGDYFYEPKWDGFRCLAFRDASGIDLRSRHDRPFSRYFPDVVEALEILTERDYVLDGELVVGRDGTFDFSALMNRLHPAASRVARLRTESPAAFIGFDILALGGRDLRAEPFVERRRCLETLLGRAEAPLFLTPISGDVRVAEQWLSHYQGAGVDGVVAKHRDLRYEPGKRHMIKIKHEQTADVVVAGFRQAADGLPLVASLMLGLYDEHEQRRLEHIGVVVGFPLQQRRQLFDLLAPLTTSLPGHPWEHGFLLEGGALGRLRGSAGRWTPEMSHDWTPVRPELVAEVAYDQVDGLRFRHPARFRRWRPDREPLSCTTDQLLPADPNVASLLEE